MSEEFDRRDWAEDLNEGIRSRDTWFRGLKILVLMFFLAIARFALLVAVAYQFCFCLVRNRPSEVMLPVGRWLARYVQKIILFMTWNSDHPPFPFSPFNRVMEREPDDFDEGPALDEEDEYFADAVVPVPPDPPAPPPMEDEAADEETDGVDEADAEPDETEEAGAEEPGAEPDDAEESGEEPEEDDEDRPSQPPRPDA